jgi:hypothetical protein
MSKQAKMPSAYTLISCYRGGGAGAYITWQVATWMPLLRWNTLYGKIADPDLCPVFLLFYATYLPTWLLGLVLRDSVLQWPVTNPACNNNAYGGVSIEFLLLAQYYVQASLFHLHFRLSVGWKSVLWHLAVIAFVVGWLASSGEYSWQEMTLGIGLGALIGLYWAYMLVDFWLPRLPFYLLHSDWMSHKVQRALCVTAPEPDHRDKWKIL